MRTPKDAPRPSGKPANGAIPGPEGGIATAKPNKRTTASPPHPEWPATKPELRAIAQIHPYPHNPRTHPASQITLLAGLMQKWGVDQPIVVDEEGVILKGHGRRMAAIEAGFTEYPVVVHRGLTETDKRAMRIEDNQVALLSGWDQQLIQTEIGSLKTGGYEIQLLGFSESTLRGWGIGAGSEGTQNPEVVPPPPKHPVVRAGDIWVLGKHRMMCADATKPETWKALFGSERASMVFTDPPYGVSYEARSGAFDIIQGDEKRRDDLYKMLLNSLRQMVKYAGDAAAFYIWHASSTREDFTGAMKAAGLAESQYLLWVKPGVVLGHSDYRWQHEPCFYASKAGVKPAFYGSRGDSTVWHAQLATEKDTAVTIGNGLLLLDGEGGTLFVQSRAPKNKKLRQIRIVKDGSVYLSGADQIDSTVWEVGRDPGHEHPTQKPVELARRAIENSSQPGQIVADGFLGSGTTLIGAELTGRRCFGTEMDPVYAEVILRRWERVTGQHVTLNGQTIDEVAKARKPRAATKRKGPTGVPARQDPEKEKGAAE